MHGMLLVKACRNYGPGSSTLNIIPIENLEEFWALKDIDLEVKEGGRLGIIGHNGAGKTTLLKVLSQITEPTAELIKK